MKMLTAGPRHCDLAPYSNNTLASLVEEKKTSAKTRSGDEVFNNEILNDVTRQEVTTSDDRLMFWRPMSQAKFYDDDELFEKCKKWASILYSNA